MPKQVRRIGFGIEPLLHRFAPEPVEQSPVPAILHDAGLGNDLAPRLYQLYREAVRRVCVL